MTIVKNELTIFAAELDFDAGRFTSTGWEPPRSLTYDQWATVGQRLQQAEGALNWLLGDWMNEGEKRYGHTFDQAIDATGHKIEKLKNCKWVSGKVKKSMRIDFLSWTHHLHVAHLDEAAQRALLAFATERQLSSRELLEAVREYERNLQPGPAISQPPAQPTLHTNGNGYHQDEEPPFVNDAFYAEPNEDERFVDDLEGEADGYDWTDDDTIPSPKLPLAAANHAISNTPGYDGDEWYTPIDIVNAARRVLGEIDLDPATCHQAQEVIQAQEFYTKEDDALRYECDWFGRVWLNPPYSMPLIKQFVTKLIDQYDLGNVTEAIIITNNSSDTSWFHSLLERFPACFTFGRVRFWRPDHEDFGTRQGQTIFYLGDNVEGFCNEFAEIGRVVGAL